MRRSVYGLDGLLLVGALGAACSAGQTSTSTIRQSRRLSIPVQFLDSTRRASVERHPEKLTLTAGAPDELPQGPVSFDIADDGVIVITDPLRERLVFYDSLGHYIEEWPIGFAPTSVSFLPGGDTVEATNATTDQRYLATRSSRPRPAGLSRGVDTAAPWSVSLERAENRGRLSLRGARGAASEITVKPEEEGARLVSVQPIGTDTQGRTFVALETTHGGEPVATTREIQLYGNDARLLSRIADVATDYFVYPEDAFRIQGTKLYQLVPRRQEILIYVWDTRNEPRR